MGSLEATVAAVAQCLIKVYIGLGFLVLIWFAIRLGSVIFNCTIFVSTRHLLCYIPFRQYTNTNAGGRGVFTPMLGSKRYHEMTKSRQGDIEKFKAKSRDEQIEEFLTKKQIRKIKEKHKKDN